MAWIGPRSGLGRVNFIAGREQLPDFTVLWSEGEESTTLPLAAAVGGRFRAVSGHGDVPGPLVLPQLLERGIGEGTRSEWEKNRKENSHFAKPGAILET